MDGVKEIRHLRVLELLEAVLEEQSVDGGNMFNRCQLYLRH